MPSINGGRAVQGDTSVTAMSRRRYTGRARRNFTLDDLLTVTEPGLAERAAQDLAPETEKRFGEVAPLSEARAICTMAPSRDPENFVDRVY